MRPSCTSVWRTLQTHFGNHPSFLNLSNDYNETAHRTLIGQLYDMNASSDAVNRLLDTDTEQKYRRIANMKTGLLIKTFGVIGMKMNGISDPIAREQLTSFMTTFGNLVQIQNDAVDCYGAPETLSYTSKPGKDIWDGQFTWFLSKALQVGNKQQVETILDNYGKQDIRCVEEVKNVYSDLRLDVHHKEHVETTLEKIYKDIHSAIWRFSPRFFHYCLGLYFRYDAIMPHMKCLFSPPVASTSTEGKR